VIWLLVVISVAVGVLIGAVGVGGILLIPALNLVGGLPIRQAMATALFSFILTGVIGTWLFQRRGSIDWNVTVPVCLGSGLFGFAGAWANSKIDARALSLMLSLMIAFAGVYTLTSHGLDPRAPLQGRPRMRQALLIGIGAVAGFGSGLTGVGGPALSVPIMVAFRFPPLTAIATSQVIQIIAAVSGTAGNLQYGSIDFAIGAWAALSAAVGVHFGVRIAHAVNAQTLRRFVGRLCVVVGIGLTVRVVALW
jgi:uncharacterized membrane protein YfcA